MTYGEKKIDGKWYYFHERTGVMATGWSKHNGHTYYYQSNGQMTYGEKKSADIGIISRINRCYGNWTDFPFR